MAAFPVLSLYSSNLALIPIEDLWRPLAVTVGGTAGLWLFLWLLFRDLRKAAVAATVGVVGMFLYGAAAPHLWIAAYPSVWIVLVGVLALLAAWKIRQTSTLNLVAVLLAVVAAGNIAWSEIRIALDVSRIRHSIARNGVVARGPTPDIYYMILDGYGRTDSLKRAIHFDDSPFIEALQSRGFYIADKSHSNYVQTEISLSSSLNLELIPKLLPSEPRGSTDRRVFDDLITNNELGRFLRDRGYRTIGITSGFPAVMFPSADLWLRNASKLSLFETMLVQMTPLAPTGEAVGSMYSWRRQTLLAAFQNLRDMAEPTIRPRFFFVHILAPHPPFVMDAQERFTRPRHGPFGYWDGSDYMNLVGDAASYRAGYAAQAQAINAEVLKTVDKLMLASTVKPVIVIQGDHGSKVGLDQNDLARTDVTECFPNLAAFYVPDSVRLKLYPGITPVNEFRLILSSLFGADLPLLPDRSWYSPFAHPFEFTDVTERVTGKR